MSETLESILALVTNPDMVGKNIKALQARLSENEAVVQKAVASKADAERRHAEAATRESVLDEREKALSEALKKHESAVQEHQKYKETLDAHAVDLIARETAYKADAKNLEDRETRLRVAQAALDKRAEDLESEAKTRNQVMAARERSIEEKKLDLDARDGVLKKKFETLRQLAG